MDPTLEELEKYKLIYEVDSDEQLLWLGAPNMKYAFLLASPTSLLFSLIFVACCCVKFGLAYGISDQNARASIVFDCIFAFTLIADLLVILSLKPFFYLITDKYLHIFVKDGWFAKLHYYTRKTHKGFSKYPLAYMRDFEVRKSYLNKEVGNIDLESSIFSDGSIYNYKAEKDITFRVKRFPIQISTIVGYANVLYCVNDVYAVCELLRGAIQKARLESI